LIILYTLLISHAPHARQSIAGIFRCTYVDDNLIDPG
jgi:hypothetical protein